MARTDPVALYGDEEAPLTIGYPKSPTPQSAAPTCLELQAGAQNSCHPRSAFDVRSRASTYAVISFWASGVVVLVSCHSKRHGPSSRTKPDGRTSMLSGCYRGGFVGIVAKPGLEGMIQDNSCTGFEGRGLFRYRQWRRCRAVRIPALFALASSCCWLWRTFMGLSFASRVFV